LLISKYCVFIVFSVQTYSPVETFFRPVIYYIKMNGDAYIHNVLHCQKKKGTKAVTVPSWYTFVPKGCICTLLVQKCTFLKRYRPSDSFRTFFSDSFFQTNVILLILLMVFHHSCAVFVFIHKKTLFYVK